MNALASYFSTPNLVAKLAASRASKALNRHAFAVYSTLFNSVPSPVEASAPFADPFLPPRRQWRRMDRKTRRTMKCDAVNAAAIRNAVMKTIKSGQLCSTPWGVRLHDLIESVQTRLSSPETIVLNPPVISLIPKPAPAGSDSRELSFRALARYADVGDWLLLGMTGKYLKEAFDGLFSDASYAFRRKAGLSHASAAGNLLQYRMQHEGRTLHVAECDIAKFFDVIDHRVVRDSLKRLVARARREIGLEIDPAALAIVEACLASYSFEENVMKCEDPGIALKLNLGQIEKPEALGVGEPSRASMPRRLGIPQGGALSPYLANCVLDQADRAVLGVNDPDLFYARFCDDMIVAHPDPVKCQAAMDRYLAALKRLGLPAHQAAPSVTYGASYYAAKSKGPYPWTAPAGNPGNIPWVSFLGYQIRYDGKLRLRAQTVDKHHDAIAKEVSDAIRFAGKEGALHKASPEKILRIVGNRIISMGVGRLSQRITMPGKPQICWLEAFPLLQTQPASRQAIIQMRSLDRSRSKQISRLRAALGRVFPKATGTGGRCAATHDAAAQRNDSRKPKVDRVVDKQAEAPSSSSSKSHFLGKPYSYVGFLEGKRMPPPPQDMNHGSFNAYTL